MITLHDIFGQDHAIETIVRAYQADRLPHGLIFAGLVGVGKATAARGLATLFLCEKPKKTVPCGKCPSCTLLESGEHPDFRVIYRELIRYHDKSGTSKGTSLSIHVIRPELVERAARTAMMGRGKVFVVEEAEYMQTPAQSALLKTLEEPIGRTLIILLTDQPHALLATIRSRCQIVRFAALDRKLVLRELEKRKIDRSDAAEAAQLAEGSLGIALKWIEDGVVAASRDLLQQIDGLLAGRAPADLADWFKKAADAYAEKQLLRDKLASKDQATREGLSLYLKLAALRFRQQLTQTTDPDALERACAAIDAIVRAEQYLDSNVNVALTFQQLATALS
ncbi:MAG: DNA polymerase III subunit delta', partial [Tepidisphaeraceae bacterium]